MQYVILLFVLATSVCLANLVDRSDVLNDLQYEHEHHHHVRQHEHRRHFRTRDIRPKCGKGYCPDDGTFVYYRCCKDRSDQCCWYLRMWVIVVFGVVLLKAFLACFVSFFRCVCC